MLSWTRAYTIGFKPAASIIKRGLGILPQYLLIIQMIKKYRP